MDKLWNRFLSDPKTARELIKGSCISFSDDALTDTTPFERWERMRKFIASAIHKSGTILDYGCANGLLLKSLQKWSEHALVPYGMDSNEGTIAEARKLFPEMRDHFAIANTGDVLNGIWPVLWPPTFDIIYWNVWDDWSLESDRHIAFLEAILRRVEHGGRLILGLYDARKENNASRIQRHARRGYEFSGPVENPTGTESIIWFDR